jgi:hypothetical protein
MTKFDKFDNPRTTSWGIVGFKRPSAYNLPLRVNASCDISVEKVNRLHWGIWGSWGYRFSWLSHMHANRIGQWTSNGQFPCHIIGYNRIYGPRFVDIVWVSSLLAGQVYDGTMHLSANPAWCGVAAITVVRDVASLEIAPLPPL